MSAYSDYIAQIGKEIEQEIENEHLIADIPEFPSVSFGLPEKILGEKADIPSKENLQQSILYTQSLKEQQVLFYRDLTSHYRGIRSIVVFGKRVIRKIVHFLLDPMTKELNQNRITAVCALEGINQHLISQLGCERFAMEEIRCLKKENQLLQERVKRLEALVKGDRKNS